MWRRGGGGGLSEKNICFSVCNCRQSDGDALCELWTCDREQAQPHMRCPKGQRVKGSTSGLHTHTHTL